MRFGDDIIHQGLILLCNKQTLLWATEAQRQTAFHCSSKLLKGVTQTCDVFRNTHKV